jgi:hypothetical protein
MGALSLLIILTVLVVIAVLIYLACPDWLPDFIRNSLLGKIEIEFTAELPDIKDDFVIGDKVWSPDNQEGDEKYDQMLYLEYNIVVGDVRDNKLFFVIHGKETEIVLTDTEKECVFFETDDKSKNIKFMCKKTDHLIQVRTTLGGCPNGIKDIPKEQLRKTPRNFSIYWYPTIKTDFHYGIRNRILSGKSPADFQGGRTTVNVKSWSATKKLRQLV